MTKRTFLYDAHKKLGARIVDFAGWYMPVQYAPIVEEHKTVREAVGLFDVSHMGEVFVSGKDAKAFLNKLVPQDIGKLTDSKAVYCQLPNKEGGLIDDLIIYKLEENKYFIVVNASRIDEDVNWMSINSLGYDVYIDNQSHNYSMLAVQGPKACDLIKALGVSELPPFFSIKEGKIYNIDMLISRTGYTGEDGVELIMKNEYVETVWNRLLEDGKAYGIKPIGLGARDTLRLEASLHLYGNDLDENTTPIEAGLSWSVPKDKTEDYNGKDVIMEQVRNGVSKKLIGFKMLDKNIARHGYDVYYGGEKVGVVTSGGISPTRGDNIGLAYIKTASNDVGESANSTQDICTRPLDKLTVGSTIQIMVRDKLHDAEIVKRPFVEKRNKG